MRLKDKVSIITGAGSGMGRVAALRFAAEGSRVIVADSQGEAAEEPSARSAPPAESRTPPESTSRSRPTRRRWWTSR